jgi:hypothetical protein
VRPAQGGMQGTVGVHSLRRKVERQVELDGGALWLVGRHRDASVELTEKTLDDLEAEAINLPCRGKHLFRSNFWQSLLLSYYPTQSGRSEASLEVGTLNTPD